MESDEIPSVTSFEQQAVAEASNPAAPCPDCYFDFVASQNQIKGPSDALYSCFASTNSYPSPQEGASIQVEIKDAITQISFINNAVSRLREAINALDKEKCRIEGVLERYRSILRPVHRLPSEILLKIFCLTSDVPASIDSEGFGRIQAPSSLCPSRPPWVLSQVCRSWRQLALDTPSLWSFVSFNFLTCEHLMLHAQCRRLQLQLHRSGKNPLDIVATTSTSDSSVIERLLFPLCSSSPYWRSLRLQSDEELFSLGMTFASGRLQALESLHLHLIGPIHHGFDYFQFASRLTRLSLSGGRRLGSNVDETDSGRLLKLPYCQITHYRWEDDDSENFLDMDSASGWVLWIFAHFTLRKLPNLQSCHLFFHSRAGIHQYIFRETAPGFIDGSLKVSLHRLIELELHTVDMKTGIHAVLPWIVHAPSLEKLTIFSSGPDRAALSTFLTHPQKLTYLSIPMVEMPPDELSAVLSRITGLKDLSFGVAGGITDGYISLFLPTHPETGDFSIVPNLQNLSLLAIPDGKSSYSENTLLDVLEARRREVGLSSGAGVASSYQRLLSVNLDRPVEGRAATVRMDQLRAEGLRVRFRSEN